NCEYMDIADVDGDGQNELLVAFNATTNAHDNYYIISAIGNWSTNDPGFSGFTAEFTKNRADLTKYGLNGGNPFAMIAAQLDGTGNKEILIHNWHYKNITPLRVTATNSYSLADTTTGKQNLFLSSVDDVALFGGLAYDIDGDGREEVYLPTYSSLVENKSKIHMIHYGVGKSTSIIDSTNVFILDLKDLYNPSMSQWFNSTYSMGYGDIDGNGKKNLYISSGFPLNLISAEFQGGDKTNMSNWRIRTLYAGIRDTEHGSITIKDSSGIIDTTWIGDNAIASKIFGRFTDFDKDGYEDILIPYQTIPDSISIERLTWNSGTSRFDTVTTTVANPKRWSFRIIEGTISTGVEAKDLTVITPDNYELYQNYPNPFNPSTEISFYLPIADKISLKIYNQLGQEVKTLIPEKDFVRGKHSVTWDGKSDFGSQVASGLYIAQLKFGNFSKEIKMMMLK
ncbi:MAG: T9SS type A sorting domain-containing protein, partial [Bacteroidetes bacterium]|nr:T9SS type A sorting domain-containing protein [Bacteroidota bacterium]